MVILAAAAGLLLLLWAVLLWRGLRLSEYEQLWSLLGLSLEGVLGLPWGAPFEAVVEHCIQRGWAVDVRTSRSVECMTQRMGRYAYVVNCICVPTGLSGVFISPAVKLPGFQDFLRRQLGAPSAIQKAVDSTAVRWDVVGGAVVRLHLDREMTVLTVDAPNGAPGESTA